MGSTLKGKNMLLLKQILPSLLRREAKIVKLLPLEVYLPYFFVHKTEFFSFQNNPTYLDFQNNPTNLDPSYKMALDLWDCLGRVNLVL